MAMPKIKVGRYDTTGGTEAAPPVGKFYAGWIEPEDRSWIVFIGADGTPFFYGSRDPATGAIEGAPLMVKNGHQILQSAHHMGDPVHVVINAGAGDYLRGHVSAVKFTEYGKVLYDVRIGIPDDGVHPPMSTQIQNVDSCFVLPPPPDGAWTEAGYQAWARGEVGEPSGEVPDPAPSL